MPVNIIKVDETASDMMVLERQVDEWSFDRMTVDEMSSCQWHHFFLSFCQKCRIVWQSA